MPNNSQTAERRTTKSLLEDKFLKLFLSQFPEHLIMAQFKSPHIRGKRSPYAFDFYIPIANLLVEVNGGIWMARGAHNTGKALQRDYDKNNQAFLAGYHLLQLDESKLNEAYLKPYFDYIRTRRQETSGIVTPDQISGV